MIHSITYTLCPACRGARVFMILSSTTIEGRYYEKQLLCPTCRGAGFIRGAVETTDAYAWSSDDTKPVVEE